MHERVAVDLGGRGDEEALALRLGEAEGLVRAERADLQRLDRQLQVIDRARGRGEVPDVVDLPGEVEELGDVLLDELEVRVAGEMGDVVGLSGDQVVDRDDGMAAGEQQVGEMGTEESRSAGDDGDRAGGRGGGGFQAFRLHADRVEGGSARRWPSGRIRPGTGTWHGDRPRSMAVRPWCDPKWRTEEEET